MHTNGRRPKKRSSAQNRPMTSKAEEREEEKKAELRQKRGREAREPAAARLVLHMNFISPGQMKGSGV